MSGGISMEWKEWVTGELYTDMAPCPDPGHGVRWAAGRTIAKARGPELDIMKLPWLREADGLTGEQATLLNGRLVCLWMADCRTLGVDYVQISHLWTRWLFCQFVYWFRVRKQHLGFWSFGASYKILFVKQQSFCGCVELRKLRYSFLGKPFDEIKHTWTKVHKWSV